MKISVALCTWNGERYLRAQIGSILSQTRQPDEIVIRDDVSSDGTVALLHTLLDGAPIHVDIAVQPRNIGSVQNFQDAIQACTGDAIFLCDQDDIWLPNKVEQMVSALEARQDAGWAFSDLALVDDSLTALHRTMWEDIGFGRDLRRVFQSDPLEALLRRPLATGAAMLVRRDLVLRSMPFPEGWVHDHWISLFITGAGRPGIAIETPLVRYRTHSAQQIGIRNNSWKSKIRKIVSAGPEEYRRYAARYDLLADRIRQAGGPDASVELVRTAAAHHEARGAMQGSSFFERIRKIAAEVRNKRYRFSAHPGFSWVKDLLGISPAT